MKQDKERMCSRANMTERKSHRGSGSYSSSAHSNSDPLVESQSSNLRCGFWNILADGLALGEFMTPLGTEEEELQWAVPNAAGRGARVAACLNRMLSACDIVGTVENDHAAWLLQQVREHSKKPIEAIVLLPPANTNSVCRKQLKARPHGLTFESEGAATVSAFYAAQPSDHYAVDDAICLYYNSKYLKFLHCNYPSLSETNLKDKTDAKYFCASDKNYFLHCVFRQKWGSKKEISVVVAHLKSGEDYKRESERVEQLKVIFEALKKYPSDSNNSVHYETEYETNAEVLSKVIEKNGYTNLVSASGNECFKMRHARGGQPEKYGQLMYDTIDKILISPAFTGKQMIILDMPFKFVPTQYQTSLILWRTNPAMRQVFNQYCSNIENIKGREDYKPQQLEKYSIDATETNRWGAAVSSIEYDLLAEELKKAHALDSFASISSKPPTMEMIKNCLSAIYPSVLAPSDHPPIMVEIQFVNH